MKYTPATIAKSLMAFGTTAIAAAVAAAAGADLSSLDLGAWMTALGSGLVAGGAVFATPNKSTASATTPADAAITAIQDTVAQATNAASELERVKQAATDVLGQVPVLGPLAQQAINRIGRP